jgi:hypothetical protein
MCARGLLYRQKVVDCVNRPPPKFPRQKVPEKKKRAARDKRDKRNGPRGETQSALCHAFSHVLRRSPPEATYETGGHTE